MNASWVPKALALALTIGLLPAFAVRGEAAQLGADEAPVARDGRPPSPTGTPPPELNRSRSTLHPGEPLVVVGIEEGDNQFRSSAPSLERAMNREQRIDREALRQERLGLYDRSATRRLPVVANVAAGLGSRRGLPANDTRQRAADAPQEEPTSSGGGWVARIFAYLMWGIGIAGTIAYFFGGRAA